MNKRVGRKPIEININSPQEGHIPVFDADLRLWETISQQDLLSGNAKICGSNNYSGSQTISGSITKTGNK